jgi:Lar family restriction alleviation protein
MKYLLSCCQRIVDVDNKPKWCLKCSRHDIDAIEYHEDTMLPCPFCGGEAQAEALDTIALYWYECEDCGGASGSGEDWVQAKAKWNKRT